MVPIAQPSRVKFISIHALLAESDNLAFDVGKITGEFLSTLSLRRATPCGQAGVCRFSNFYPRSPCGERPHSPFVPP